MEYLSMSRLRDKGLLEAVPISAGFCSVKRLKADDFPWTVSPQQKLILDLLTSFKDGKLGQPWPKECYTNVQTSASAGD